MDAWLHWCGSATPGDPNDTDNTVDGKPAPVCSGCRSEVPLHRAQEGEVVLLVKATGGVALIATERQAHTTREGWTPEHDAEHTGAEMTKAAAVYALRSSHQIIEAAGGRQYDARLDIPPMTFWPHQWDRSWWKPSEDPVRNLVKAGSLIAAEIDRLTTP